MSMRGSGVGRRRGEGPFRQALSTHPPPPPPSLLRRLGTKEISGLGKVKVVLRVREGRDEECLLNVDTKKRQVTLSEPSQDAKPSPEDRRPTVSAPKMFAFDALFTPQESQSDVCASGLTDLIHAVINGVDSCLFSFGHTKLGKTDTMVGGWDSPGNMGAIPCAISWLFRCINEQKQKTGTRFSVRVSAVEVAAPVFQTKDLLANYAYESAESAGAYLNDGSVELRAPTPEQAASYLDIALASRAQQYSHLFFTLHLYQYSVGGKGSAVSGGRSRLHLIDLGSSGKGLPLSGIGNILLAIFNGQKHYPHREHKLTHQLRECLGSLTCHAAMIAHVSPLASNYTDTLTTLQFASRIHRMRRRRFKFLGNSCIVAGEDGSRLTGSSDFDPSSSEQSADTVIYLGPSEETDGEHPPVYIPSLNSGDNRGAMGKVLKGSILDQKSKMGSKSVPASPQKSLSEVCKKSTSKANSARSSPVRVVKGSTSEAAREERWVDGPRVPRSRASSQPGGKETWIDGPNTRSNLYGFMDQHKKNMIRQWVENQSAHVPRLRHKPHNPAPTELPLEKLQCSGPKSPDVPVADEMEVEIIEVEEPAEPVPMQDSCLQVTEEDIALCMGELENPLPEVDQEEHPLRILSQENLTIVSTFTGNSTDSLTAANEMDRIIAQKQKLFCRTNGWQEKEDNDILSAKLRQYEQLNRLHEIYESRMKRTDSKPVSRCHSLLFSDMRSDSNDFETNSIASEPAYLPGENKGIENLSKGFNEDMCWYQRDSSHLQTFRQLTRSISSLRGVSGSIPASQNSANVEEDEEIAMPPPPLKNNLLSLNRTHQFDSLKLCKTSDGKNMKNGVHDPGGTIEFCRREEWGWSENYVKLSEVSRENCFRSANRIISPFNHQSLFDQRNQVPHAANQ